MDDAEYQVGRERLRAELQSALDKLANQEGANQALDAENRQLRSQVQQLCAAIHKQNDIIVSLDRQYHVPGHR